jgi:hypothetical protein
LPRDIWKCNADSGEDIDRCQSELSQGGWKVGLSCGEHEQQKAKFSARIAPQAKVIALKFAIGTAVAR